MAEGREAEPVEKGGRILIPRNGADPELLDAFRPRSLDGGFDERAPDALPPQSLRDDHGLDLSSPATDDEARQADDRAGLLRNPEVRRAEFVEMPVEAGRGIVAADRRVAVELPVPLRQLCPEPVAGLGVPWLEPADRD